MEKFELKLAKGLLKKCTTSKKKSKEDGKPRLSNDVQFLIVVDKRCHQAVEYLFPNYKKIEEGIINRDGDHPGMSMQAQGKTPELNFTVYDGGGSNEVFCFERVSLKGSPRLLVNSLGQSRLEVRLDAKMSKKDMSKLVDYIDSDIYIDAEVAQPLLPGIADAKAKSEAIEATQPLSDDSDDDSEPTQQNLNGSMPAEELRAFRENNEWSRAELIEWLGTMGVSVSPKSLQRYENGARDVPNAIAEAVQAAT